MWRLVTVALATSSPASPPPPTAPCNDRDTSEHWELWKAVNPATTYSTYTGLCDYVSQTNDVQQQCDVVSFYHSGELISARLLCCVCGGGAPFPSTPPLPPSPPPKPPYQPGAFAKQDPHLRLFDGGRADFRGKNDTYYVLHSSPGLQVAARTSDTEFLLPNPARYVYGSFFTAFSATLRTEARDVFGFDGEARVPGFTALDQYGARVAEMRTFWRGWKRDRSEVFLRQETITISSSGWEVNVTRRPIFHFMKGTSDFRYDFSFAPTSKVTCFPHGIISQSFDNDRRAINGRLDDYDTPVVVTKAMAEGAIEGTAEQYALFTPHARSLAAFRYSRFEKAVADVCAPRDVSELAPGPTA